MKIQLLRNAKWPMAALALAAALGAAAGAERSPEELKAGFKQAYAALDTRAMEAALEELDARWADHPLRSRLTYELGRLDGYASFSEFSLMREEAHRAEQVYKQFLPGGPFAASPEAPMARVEYAWHLLKTGWPEQSRSLYNALAHEEDPRAFTMAVRDVAQHFELEADPPLLDLWLRRAEAMAEKVKALPAQNQGDLPKLLERPLHQLRAQSRGKAQVYLLLERGERAARRARIAVDCGDHARAVEEFRKADPLLTEWLSKPHKGGEAEELNARLTLAQAKSWERDPKAARTLLDDVLARPQAWLLGPEPQRYGAALMWSIGTDRLLGRLRLEEEEARLADLAASGRLDVHHLQAVLKRLAAVAQERGDLRGQRACLHDMMDALPDPAMALKARRALERFDREHPEAQGLSAGQISPLMGRLIEAGMVQPHPGAGRALIVPLGAEEDSRRPSFQWLQEAP